MAALRVESSVVASTAAEMLVYCAAPGAARPSTPGGVCGACAAEAAQKRAASGEGWVGGGWVGDGWKGERLEAPPVTTLPGSSRPGVCHCGGVGKAVPQPPRPTSARPPPPTPPHTEASPRASRGFGIVDDDVDGPKPLRPHAAHAQGATSGINSVASSSPPSGAAFRPHAIHSVQQTQLPLTQAACRRPSPGSEGLPIKRATTASLSAWSAIVMLRALRT